MAAGNRFEGITLTTGRVDYQGQGGPIAGARASVETDGEVVRRFTASRLILLGPLGLAFKKKKDRRELYLTVEGDAFAFVAKVNPNKGAEAREFAARINSAAREVAAAPPAMPTASLDLTSGDVPLVLTGASSVAPAMTSMLNSAWPGLPVDFRKGVIDGLREGRTVELGRLAPAAAAAMVDKLRKQGFQVDAVPIPAPEPEPEVVESPGDGPGPSDILEQLKRLAELRDLGVISVQEFEAKKAEMLGRI